ncbi:unnamed protein product [Paramecium pentaurelia]|uniref:Uncharacterized protein n=1 Tax=Paramecium pentaurelia TaxID=43138 RepID=A0A8S1YF18_9CILI|nr:unnamed protein product [Paramecium pentaurelia]
MIAYREAVTNGEMFYLVVSVLGKDSSKRSNIQYDPKSSLQKRN